jgi:hypothetical protein
MREDRKEKNIQEKNLLASPAPSATDLSGAIQEVKKKAFKLIQNRSVFNKRHDEHLERWIGNCGLHRILDSLDAHDFTTLDYFYSEVDEKICLWEKMFLDSQLARYEEEKKLYNQPIFKEF